MSMQKVFVSKSLSSYFVFFSFNFILKIIEYFVVLLDAFSQIPGILLFLSIFNSF